MKISRKTRGRSLPKTLYTASRGLLSYFRSWDDYGQAVSFNYEGSETFKTLPGAFLSILAKLLLLAYLLHRGTQLVNNLNWTLTTQTTNSSFEDLKTPITFKDEANFTLGIELTTSLYQGVRLNDSLYFNYSKAIAKYTTLAQFQYNTQGRDTLEFLQAPNLLEFPDTFKVKKMYWKDHEQAEMLSKNSYGFYEYDIDLSEMALMGSVSSFEPLPTQFSTFIIQKDAEGIITDAFEQCDEDDECRPEMEGEAFIENALYQEVYSNPNSLD